MTFLDRLFGLEVKNKENKQFKPQVGVEKKKPTLSDWITRVVTQTLASA